MNSVYDSYSDEEEDYSDEDYYINPNSSIKFTIDTILTLVTFFLL